MLLRSRAHALAVVLGGSLALLARAARADRSSTRECIAAATEGQKLRDRGKLLDARARFLHCASDACPSDIRADCGRWLSRVEDTTPHVVFGARDEEGRDRLHVRVLSHDVVLARELAGREQAVDPGPYDFVFEADDGTRVTVSAVLRAGDGTRALVATFPSSSSLPSSPAVAGPATGPLPGSPPSSARSGPVPAPPPTGDGRTVALVASGTGALLAAGAFVFFALHARASYGDLERSCAPGCTDAETRGVRTDLVVANVSGVAALALGALFGGLVLFTRPPASRPAPSASLGAVSF